MIGASNLDWEAIKSFAVVADRGTVRRAARELGVHHSTLSRRIDSLEQSLGARLFVRSPDGFVLTDAGVEFLNAAQASGMRLSDAERSISGQEQQLRGVVAVTMVEPVAVSAFAPRLHEFSAQYPDIEIELIATTDFLDVTRMEADIAIRMDNNPPLTLVGKRLFPYYQTAYASPDYLETHNLIDEPENARWLGWDSSDERFPPWTQETAFAKVPVWGNFASIPTQQAAARGGLGLTLLPCFVADHDPGLVRVSDASPTRSRDIWLLTHDDLRHTAKIRAFMQFAETVLRANKNRFLGRLGPQSEHA